MLGLSDKRQSYADTIFALAGLKPSQTERDWLAGNNTGGIPASFLEVVERQSKRRYRFDITTNRDLVIHSIFQSAFDKNSSKVIASAENVNGRHFYPSWKKMALIKIPGSVATTLVHPLFRIPSIVLMYFKGVSFAQKHYAVVHTHVNDKLIPSVMKRTPPLLVSLVKRIANCYLYIVPMIVLYCAITEILIRCPEIPHVTKFARRYRLNPLKVLFAAILGAHTSQAFFVQIFIDICKFSWNQFRTMSHLIGAVASRAETNRMHISKDKAYRLWIQTQACS